MDWETVFDDDLTNQWQYSEPTDFNVFRFTCANPFNLSTIAIAQAEVSSLTQLFNLQRLGVRPESEICVIEKPPFFSDRRLAVRGIPSGANRPLSGSLKIEGMSMAISQVRFSPGWTREGSTLVSPTQQMFLSFDGSKNREIAHLLVENHCKVVIGGIQYGLLLIGPTSTEQASVTARASYHLPSSAISTVWLSDIPWISASNGFGPVERDRANGEDSPGDGPPLTVGGVVYSKGLGVHASSEIVFNLDGVYEFFSALVGVDDAVADRGSVVFQVLVDGIERFSSGLMTGNTEAIPVSVNVSGANQLTLICSDGGDGISYDHGNWCNAALSTLPGAPISASSGVSVPVRQEERGYKIGLFTFPFAVEEAVSLVTIEISSGNEICNLIGCCIVSYRFEFQP